MSNQVKIVPFEPSHIDLMDLRQFEKESIGTSAKDYANLSRNAECGTLLVDGRIIAVIGFMEILPGNWEVFALPTIWLSHHKLAFIRTVRNYMKVLQKSHNIKRFQTASRDDAFHTRWMEFMGFECETPQGMRNYSKGITFKLWAKVY